MTLQAQEEEAARVLRAAVLAGLAPHLPQALPAAQQHLEADWGPDWPAVFAEACAIHHALLVRWNTTHNLTRVVEPLQAARVHYLDCLVPLLLFAAPIEGVVVDVGSGAGFPGLVVRFFVGASGGNSEAPRPVLLVEPARKRQSFLQVAGPSMLAVQGGQGAGMGPGPGPGKGARPQQVPEVLSPLQAQKDPRTPAPWVLTRATFSEGLRREAFGYVAAGGVLWAWATAHERPTWEKEAATWPGATATWHPYDLADGIQRGIVAIHRP